MNEEKLVFQFLVSGFLLIIYDGLLRYIGRNSHSFCFLRGVDQGAERARAPVSLRWDLRFLLAADFFCGPGGDLCIDERFCRAPDGSGRRQRLRRMAATVADAQGREGRLRRLHRNEDRAGHRCRNFGWNRYVRHRFDHCNTNSRIRHNRRDHGEDGQSDVGCLYHYARCGGRQHSARRLSLSGLSNLRPGRRFLSRIFDLLFFSALSSAKRGALSPTSTGFDRCAAAAVSLLGRMAAFAVT